MFGVQRKRDHFVGKSWRGYIFKFCLCLIKHTYLISIWTRSTKWSHSYRDASFVHYFVNPTVFLLYLDVFGAAKGWAATIVFHENLRKQFKSFYHREDTFSFGVCNGCQLMCLINWIGNEGVYYGDWKKLYRSFHQRIIS